MGNPILDLVGVGERRDVGTPRDTSHPLSVGNGAGSGERPAGTLSRREEGNLDGLWSFHLWASPVGLGIFLAGLGVLLWGASKVMGKME